MLRILSTLLILIMFIEVSHGKMLDAFSNCNVGGKDGTNKSSNSSSDDSKVNKNQVPSSAVKFSIERNCDSVCRGALSAKDTTSQKELNDDFILECKNVCRLFPDYSYNASKRVGDPQSFTKNINDPASGISYEMQTQYSIIKYNPSQSLAMSGQGEDIYFSVTLDNTIKNIKLDTNYENVIYTCGHKITVLEPTFPNMFQMSPHSINGGNVNELIAKEMIEKGKPSLTENLMRNKNYAGVYDFDHDDFIKTNKFSDDEGDLQVLLKQISSSKKTPPVDFSLYNGIDDRNMGFAYKALWATSTSESDWDTTTATYHPCFTSKIKFTNLTASDGKQRMDNASILLMQPSADPKNKEVSRENYPQLIGCYPDWNIYNRNFVNTGINVSNGDYLSISWGGNIIVGNGLSVPFIDLSIAKMIASGDKWVFDKYSKNKFQNINFLNVMSSIEFEGLERLIGEAGLTSAKPDGDNSQICNNKSIYDRLGTKSKSWYGLNGAIIRTPSNNPNSDVNDDGTTTFNCKTTSLGGDKYIFSGYVNGLSRKTPLNIRHYIPHSGLEEDLYKNSILNGGYQVRIEWGGCPIRDGEGLEYAFGSSDTDPSKISTWKKIDKTKLNSGGYTFGPESDSDSSKSLDDKYDSQYTKVFFRVNTQSANPNMSPDGVYYLKITEIEEKHVSSVPWYDLTRNIAQAVFETLIGDVDAVFNPNIKFDGALITASNAIAAAIAPLVKVVLVFYMMMIGIGFMSGAIKMNQKECIGIMLKISLVLMIFSDTGRVWFVDNYIGLFIIGVMKLALKMQNLIYEILGDNPNSNPDDVFNLFSMWKLWWYIMKEAFSKRLIALAFSSLAGFAIALVIIVASVASIIVLLKAIMAYISAMITQGILLLIAPFFFMLNLFKITSGMFQEWTKQVMGFALIPIAVSITVTLFLLMITIGIEACMGFGYCLGCLIEMFGSCVVQSYYTLNLMFMPEDTSTSFILPLGIVSGALTFIVIAYTGLSAVEIGVGLMLRLTTFRFETYGQDNMSGVAMTSAQSVFSTAPQVPAALGGRNLNPVKSWKVWRKDAWDFSDFGKKDVELGLRDEKKLDEIGKELDKLDKPPGPNHP